MTLKNSSLSLIGGVRGTPGNTHSSSDRPHEMNRYMGGHRRVNHPYITGYWYLIIEPPLRLFSDKVTGSSESGSHDGENDGMGPGAYEASRWLHSTAEGFTPPTRTLTKVDVPGLGGVGSSFVAGQQLTRTFTVTFREYQDTPILNTINLWTSVIDHHYGVSPLMGTEYIPANYKGGAWVFLCKPSLTTTGTTEFRQGGEGGAASDDYKLNFDDVEQFFFFEGVFPEAPPFDGFNSDIATNDVTQLSVTFSFDGWPKGKENIGAYKEGINRLNIIHNYNFEWMQKHHLGADSENIKDLMTPSTTTVLGGSNEGTFGQAEGAGLTGGL